MRFRSPFPSFVLCLLACAASLWGGVPETSAAVHPPAGRPPAGRPQHSPAPVRLTFFHVNDWHGTLAPTPAVWLDRDHPRPIGGPGVLATLLAARKAAVVRTGGRFLLVDAGDRFQGTLEVNLSKGRLMTQLGNLLRFHLATIGNHDFDYGPEALRRDARNLRFPLLCANLHGPGAVWRPSLIVPVGPLKIGFLGLITADLPTLTFPELIAGLTLESPEQAARREARKLREKGCNHIVVLSHCGHEFDRRLAQRVPGLDLIVGGHTDHHTSQPVRIGQTLIVQTRGYGSHVGELAVEIDPSQPGFRTASYTNHLLDPASFPEDPTVLALLASAGRDLETLVFKPVGTLSQTLDRRAREGPTSLGSLLARAIARESQADLAVFHLGGIRADLTAGPLVFRDVYQAFPFDHQIIVGRLSGRDVQDLVRQGTDGRGSDLCLAGPLTGNPIDPDRSYSVAFNDFLERGGDGYPQFGRATKVNRTGRLVRDCLVDALGGRPEPAP